MTILDELYCLETPIHEILILVTLHRVRHDLAQLIADLLPAVVSDAWIAPECVVGVVFALDVQQRRVIVAPESLPPLGLEREALFAQVSARFRLQGRARPAPMNPTSLE